jgi:hypothetical protein
MRAFSGTSVQSTQVYILNEIVRVNSSLIFPITAAFITTKNAKRKRSPLVAFCAAEMAGD